MKWLYTSADGKILNRVNRDAWQHEFKITDDDGNTIARGVCDGLDNADGDEAFAPLDRLEGDGATTMYYRKMGDSTWHQL